jgi:large subunit ribosomal protein L21
MYALVEIKGKQYKAEKGGLLKVDKLNQDSGSAVEFDSVLLVSNNGDVKVGDPYVKGVSVKAVVEGDTRGKKIIVMKYKKRKSYRKKTGHKQSYSVIKVEDISGAN